MVAWDKFELGNSICSPVMPGTTLSGASANVDYNGNNHYSSPWWAPAVAKGTMHAFMCGKGRNLIQLEWMPGYGTENKILVKNGKNVILNRKVLSAQVKNDGLALAYRHGRTETVSSLW